MPAISSAAISPGTSFRIVTRIDPRVAAPVHDCCCPASCGCDHRNEAGSYVPCPDDPRIELPRENNYFDPNTVIATILHLDYAARKGGDSLRH
jgi:hypothetical protein